MKIIIIGCGRVGAGLARSLSMDGHTVTVVDVEPAAFERLGPAFTGRTITGVGLDRDVLLRAGIERADGLAAVTGSDEVNVVVARLAGQVFHVPRVVVRLYDPRKADIYRRLGLQTISPVQWGIGRIAALLRHSPLNTVVSLGSGGVDLVEADVPALLVGRTVRDVTVAGEIHVAAVSRGGTTFLPTLGTVLQDGDVLMLVVAADSAGRLETLLGVS